MDARHKTLPDLKKLVDFIASEYKPERIILFAYALDSGKLSE